jgi:hypothetical protein
MFVSSFEAQVRLGEPTPRHGTTVTPQSEEAVIVIVVVAAIALSEFNENIEKNNIKSNFDFI